MIDKKIVVIGAGNMGGALMTGWVRSKEVSPGHITAVDVAPDLLAQRKAELGVQTSQDARAVVPDCDVVVLGLKPQVWTQVVRDFKDVLHAQQVVVSIMAGIRLAVLEQELGPLPLVRVMPNILAQVGAAGSGMCAGPTVSDAQHELVLALLDAVGATAVVREDQMDAITGLAGSGPAYVYAMMDAMADGGVRMGLSKADALALAVQTMLGAARMVLESGEHPALLKDRVISPGGTTIAGLHALEQGGIRATLMNAVAAAARQSEALGK